MQSDRLTNLEQAIQARLPSEYRSFLVTHVAQDQPDLSFPSEHDAWDIRLLYELAGGALDDQVDRVYSLVRDVIPKHMLPIGEDWGGNFYCLVVSGDLFGQIFWWNHERAPGDDRVESVASSFEVFISGLAPRDEA
jgi:hypothetical protein